MKDKNRFVLAAVVAVLVGCQAESVPTTWSELQQMPAGFKDGVDDVRSDEEIRNAAKGHFVETEADPTFGASAASQITSDQVAQWNATSEAGDHRLAGYLSSELDPVFLASPAASVTSAEVSHWNVAFAWGDHAQAGYLVKESDPGFAASPAATITAQDLSALDEMQRWGNHATAGYLTTEKDPKIGALSTGKIPMWDGAKLSEGSVSESGGKVGIGAAPGTAALTVTDVAKLGVSLPTETTKSCSIAGSNWTHTPPSAGACNAYCTARGFVGGEVSSGPTRPAAGAFCDYISDFETCTSATIPNSGGCNTRTSSFTCTCQVKGVEVSGSLRVLAGNVGIGVTTPSSPLHLNGYLQLGTTSGSPPTADCDQDSERARMLVDPQAGKLWICASSGWIAK